MKKRFIVLVALLSLFLFLPACTAPEEIPSNDEPLDFTEGGGSRSGDGWKWNAEEKILTLDGLTMSWNLDARKDEDVWETAMIELPPNSTVKLVNDSVNQINIFAEKSFLGMSAIACEDGSINFEGTGSLEINGVMDTGIYAEHGDVVINSGEFLFTGDRGYAIQAGKKYIQNKGTITAKSSGIYADDGIIINDGNLTVEDSSTPIAVYEGNIEINGGVVTNRQSGEESAIAESWVAITGDNWIINGGELYTTGVCTNEKFIVNDGFVQIEKVGLNLDERGYFEQNGGKVLIYSEQAGIGNRVNIYEDNEKGERISLNGGELEIHCSNPQYSAIELILEKKREQTVLGKSIVWDDTMQINETDWKTCDIAKDSAVWQRDTIQDYNEERDYCITVWQSGDSVVAQEIGAQDVVIKEK